MQWSKSQIEMIAKVLIVRFYIIPANDLEALFLFFRCHFYEKSMGKTRKRFQAASFKFSLMISGEIASSFS